MTNQTIHPCSETTGRKRKYEFVAHPDGTHGYTILIPETACDGELHALEKLAIAQRDRIAELESRLSPDPRVAVLEAENKAMKARVYKMIPLFSSDGIYSGDCIQGRLFTVIDAANEASKLIAAQRGEG